MSDKTAYDVILDRLTEEGKALKEIHQQGSMSNKEVGIMGHELIKMTIMAEQLKCLTSIAESLVKIANPQVVRSGPSRQVRHFLLENSSSIVNTLVGRAYDTVLCLCGHVNKLNNLPDNYTIYLGGCEKCELEFLVYKEEAKEGLNTFVYYGKDAVEREKEITTKGDR